MAGASLYQDNDEQAGITDINVTPFVDVVLVLLVVFIVTAKLIVARGVDIEKPKMAAGGDVQSTLRVSVTADGKLYVNGDPFTDDRAAVARIKEIAATTTKPKAIIAGDRKAAYGGVMHAIQIVHDANVTSIALENERQ
jgi:biopolymer transport protein ExbD